jgi:eukaryotic-like serine/threonine-protein kinase
VAQQTSHYNPPDPFEARSVTSLVLPGTVRAGRRIAEREADLRMAEHTVSGRNRASDEHTPGRNVGRVAFSWAVVGLILVDVVVIVGSVWIFGRKGTIGWEGGVEIVDAAGRPAVGTVDPRSKVANLLQPGDQIVAIDGDRRVDSETFLLFAPRLASGARIRVLRDRQELDLVLPPVWAPVRGPLSTLFTALPPGLALVGSGAVVGLLRPELQAARLFALAALISAPPVITHSGRVTQMAGALSPWENWFICLAHAPAPFHLVITLAFLFAFPARPVLGRGWQLLGYAIGAGGVVAWLASMLRDVTMYLRPAVGVSLAWENPSVWHGLQTIVFVYPGLAFGTMVLIVLRKYRGTAEREERRRLKWMVAGAVTGILPLCLYFLLEGVFVFTSRDLPGWLGDVAYSLVTVLPVAVSYAVARHQLFDIRVVVRRGLQYLLAVNSLRVAVAISVVLIAVEVVRDPSASVRDLPRRPMLWLALLATGNLLYWRPTIFAFLDRHFFRSAYSEPILLSLIEEIGGQDSAVETARLIGERLESSLHPETLQIYLRGGGERSFVCQYASRSSEAYDQDDVLPMDAPFVELLERNGKAVHLSSSEYVATGPRTPESGAQLAVPLGGGERLLAGILLLGARQSEEPYSAKDVQLLETIAGQLMLVHENAALRHRVGDERRVREQVLARLDGSGVNLLRECPVCGSCFDGTDSDCPRDGSRLTLTHPIERDVAGRWRLERRLGAGGMGTVFEATDLRLGRRVALKLMRQEGNDERSRQRFEREARALARLQHPHLVTLFDFGNADPGGAFIVMELVNGETLRQELRRGIAIPPATLAEWFDQIVDGVAYAHRHQVIHRDLKPENVILTPADGGSLVPKVLDFGLAKFRLPDSGGDTALTRTGTVLGTLDYMAPEQLVNAALVDERTDMFALGVMVVEALVGRHPFRHDDAEHTAARILRGTIHLPGDDPQIRTLEGLLRRSLAKKREDRFSNLDTFRAEVIPALRRCPPLPVATTPSGNDAREPSEPTIRLRAGPTLPLGE